MKFLIPLSYLNEACKLSGNIDEKDYKIFLKVAQFDLSDILGQEFYEQIETQYQPANDTFTTANATLYEDYLKDYLAWSTYHRYLGFSQSQSTPTGERLFNDENSNLLVDIALAAKEKNVLGMVKMYQNRIVNYIENEQSKVSTAFPLWNGCKEGNYGFSITGIERNSYLDKTISISKAVTKNE
jgi:hypothetical protein